MTQGRAMEYEKMISEIKKFIEEKKDFFVGGRGIGIECRRMSVYWLVKIERAVFISYPDVIVCEHDALKLYYERSGLLWLAEFDLKHYLKVKAI